MKFFHRLISVAAVVAVTIDATPLSKRVLGGITLCTDINFTGFCLHLDLARSRCTDITDPGLVGQVSSIQPDSAPHDCLMFTAPCGSAGTSVFVGNSGVSNFGNLDNLAASVECQW
ncbi:hypothetical protein DFH09DRAFT_1162504 [Mycena vulgaris]|nr:hypothetical protein DFH09DRAFT_1215997 [Mycena vulgaris]KAJ6558781.1 hypothetical protein DFH09DRAFT_1162504 [Mycena vulgaris]